MGGRGRSGRSIHDFLGSAQIFASAVDDLVEKRLLREEAGSGLTLPQFRLLRMIALTDARTITDVAVFLGVSRAAASKAVDRMVRRKLIRRAEGEPDRRQISLSLTGAGERLLDSHEERRLRRLAEIFRAIPERELVRSAYVLDRLSAALMDSGSHHHEVCLRCGIYFRERCVVRRLAKRDCFYLRRRRGGGAAAEGAEKGPAPEAGGTRKR